MWRLKVMVWVLGWISCLGGCSVVGQASKAYLTAANATFKAQPQALRDAQPVWIKRAYYSTELLIEPVSAWRLQLRSAQALTPAQLQASVILSYQHRQQQFLQQVRLQLRHQQFESSSQRWLYLYQLDAAVATPFWQQFQQLLWQVEKPKFNFLLQPELTGITNYSKLTLQYQYASSFGLLSLGEMARLNMAFKDADWELLCNSDLYRYQKTSACGQSLIRDKEQMSAQTTP